ncbi:hypothetical protein GCM10014713_36150 [Streptomyces purpureus]|uniref:Uncharacterized protein n=1 Tax=Streptomyces purpureus TaxID=1951 RepID=A0A918H7D7_9ACTN|nr:hypothetical protein GCM10014713_36150 [Streptomyces purpureus]
MWTGWYRDRRGAEAIVITAGGRRVATRIRGIEYEGADFAALRAADGTALNGCVLEWDLPLPVVTGGTAQPATLSCLLTVSDRVDLNLTLHCGGTAYESGIAGGGFDEALARIARQLPPGAEFGRRLLENA